MQNSRLARLGKQTLKNRSNFTLLQQINSDEFSTDKPIKNTSTVYLDENGKQRQTAQLSSPILNKVKSNNTINKNITNNESQLNFSISDSNARDLYALPVVNVNNNSSNNNNGDNMVDLRASGKLNSKSSNFSNKDPKTKMIKSQYVQEDDGYSNSNDRKNRRQKKLMDSIKEVQHSHVYSQASSMVSNNSKRGLLNIRRPKGFQRKQERMEEIDFIGDNLYQVQDIISDIGKIMDTSKRRNIVQASKQPSMVPLKANKWLNNHFGQMNKLDQILANYKSIPEQQPAIPITQDFYRQSTYMKNTPKLEQSKSKSNNKINSFNFAQKLKAKNDPKLSLVVIKWNQMPMIATKWQPSIYLKLHSFPQQQEYRRVVLKAYSLGIKSYSIFHYANAGVIEPSASNDKNAGLHKLMSQEQYAKTWQKYYPVSQNSQQTLSQQQKQLLMEFDIEWYRTFIEFCYHSGLQDVLQKQKQHDVQTYIAVIGGLQRLQNIKAELIISNQIKYMRQYFQDVYSYGSNQDVIGLIRVQNDQKMEVHQIYSNFYAMLNDQEQGRVPSIDFGVWPLSQDNTSLVVVMQLCGNRDSEHISLNNQEHNMTISMKNPNFSVLITQQISLIKSSQSQKSQLPSHTHKLILRPEQDNNWELAMKIQNNDTQSPPKDNENDEENINLKRSKQFKVILTQELLFGIIYTVETNGKS